MAKRVAKLKKAKKATIELKGKKGKTVKTVETKVTKPVRGKAVVKPGTKARVKAAKAVVGKTRGRVGWPKGRKQTREHIARRVAAMRGRRGVAKGKVEVKRGGRKKPGFGHGHYLADRADGTQVKVYARAPHFMGRRGRPKKDPEPAVRRRGRPAKAGRRPMETAAKAHRVVRKGRKPGRKKSKKAA